MENIVDYLIVLFFIISFLSSFFKKKKKPIAKSSKATQQPVVELQKEKVREEKPVENKPQPQKKSALEEILKAMLEVPQPIEEKVEEEKSEVDAYFEEALKNSTMMEEESYYKETQPVEQTPKETIEYQENQNTYLNTILENHKKHTNQKAMKIKNDLLNSQKLKEYLVMNEILGKPLALRE